MEQLHIEESRAINATLPTVYAILADYNKGHQQILPKRYFKKLTVLQGGRGAGTRIEVEMSILGQKSTLNMLVSEPEPGRVLVETDVEAGVTTTFTLEPTDKQQTKVTIASVLSIGSGWRGSLQKVVNEWLIRRIYRQELKLLEHHANRLSASRASEVATVKRVPNSSA